jgi:hypothetical protein
MLIQMCVPAAAVILSSGEDGGAVSAYNSARFAIRNCTFNYNNATFGGAILLFGDTAGWLRTV